MGSANYYLVTPPDTSRVSLTKSKTSNGPNLTVKLLPGKDTQDFRKKVARDGTGCDPYVSVYGSGVRRSDYKDLVVHKFLS